MKSFAVTTILKLFDVSRKEAEIYADEFFDLVESKGGNPNRIDIENQIPKVFSERLQWRNTEVKAAHEIKIKKSEEAYNEYIISKNKTKW